jgi:hypothetical protein
MSWATLRFSSRRLNADMAILTPDYRLRGKKSD